MAYCSLIRTSFNFLGWWVNRCFFQEKTKNSICIHVTISILIPKLQALWLFWIAATSEDCSSQVKRGRNLFFFQKAPSYLLCPRQAQRVWIFKVSSEECKWADCYELEVIKTTYWDNRPIQFLLYCRLFSNPRDLFFTVLNFLYTDHCTEKVAAGVLLVPAEKKCVCEHEWLICQCLQGAFLWNHVWANGEHMKICSRIFCSSWNTEQSWTCRVFGHLEMLMDRIFYTENCNTILSFLCLSKWVISCGW